jgi:hypothetical protein
VRPSAAVAVGAILCRVMACVCVCV